MYGVILYCRIAVPGFACSVYAVFYLLRMVIFYCSIAVSGAVFLFMVLRVFSTAALQSLGAVILCNMVLSSTAMLQSLGSSILCMVLSPSIACCGIAVPEYQLLYV